MRTASCPLRPLLPARRRLRRTAATQPPDDSRSPGWISERLTREVEKEKAARIALTGDADKLPDAPGAPLGSGEQYMSYDDEQYVFGYETAPGEGPPLGPPVVIAAGLRAEEAPRLRELLDELGGHDVKVLLVRHNSAPS